MGWCCKCDEMSVGVYNANKMCDNMKLVNRYDLLQHEGSNECGGTFESVSLICEVGHSSNMH